jgi:WD40 repeat protein
MRHNPLGVWVLACLALAATGLIDLPRASAQQPKPRAVLDAHRGSVSSLAYSPDGKTLATGGDVGGIKLWDVPNVGREKK